MRTSCWVAALLAGALLSLGPGCAPSGKRRPLSGSVTFRGRALEDGTITFLTTSGPPGPAGGARVQAGQYAIPAAQGLEPGTYRVAISSPGPPARRTPEEIAADASARATDRIPEKYNTETTLEIEVTAGGPTRFDFDLE
jgi:hypothetical protein